MSRRESVITPSYGALVVSLLSIAIVVAIGAGAVVAADVVARVVLPAAGQFIEWTIDTLVDTLVSHP